VVYSNISLARSRWNREQIIPAGQFGRNNYIAEDKSALPSMELLGEIICDANRAMLRIVCDFECRIVQYLG
jgi:hypothetical protein